MSIIRTFLLGTLLSNFYISNAQTPKIAVQLYSFRTQLAKDVPTTLAKLNTMGVKYVELAGTYGKTIPEFLALLQQFNLTPIGSGADFADLATQPEKVAQDAKALGVRYVVCFWIPHEGDDFNIQDVQKAAEVFNRAGKILREQGLTFCYHPHGYEFRPYGKSTLFDELAQKLDPHYVNFEMDTYWIKHPGQDPVAMLKKYPNRFPLLHLKDRKIGTVGNQNGRTDVETNVTLGTGDIDISSIMKVASKIGVEYAIIEDESSRSETQVPQSLAFLQKFK